MYLSDTRAYAVIFLAMTPAGFRGVRVRTRDVPVEGTVGVARKPEPPLSGSPAHPLAPPLVEVTLESFRNANVIKTDSQLFCSSLSRESRHWRASPGEGLRRGRDRTRGRG